MQLKDIARMLKVDFKAISRGELPAELRRTLAGMPLGRRYLEQITKQEADNPVTYLPETTTCLSPLTHFLPIIVDPSVGGMSGVIDGKKRLVWFILLAQAGRISWELDLPVLLFDCTESHPREKTAENGLLNPHYVRRFLQENWQGETPHEQVLSHFTRRVLRHYAASLNASSRHAAESALLAVELSEFLAQNKIATLLQRSEGWVSEAVGLGQLKENYREALSQGVISYSTALLLSRCTSQREQELLFRLATEKGYSIRRLRVAWIFMASNPEILHKEDALERLEKIAAEREFRLADQVVARVRLLFRAKKPLWQIAFLRKGRRRQEQELQTGNFLKYQYLLQKFKAVEQALAQFPLP